MTLYFGLIHQRAPISVMHRIIELSNQNCEHQRKQKRRKKI